MTKFPDRRKLCKMFSYDAETGAFLRLINKRGTKATRPQPAGFVVRAGRLQRPSMFVTHEGRRYRAEHIVYYIHTGVFKRSIMFRDGNRLNLRFENLYPVESGPLKGRAGVSRPKGVSWCKRPEMWKAHICLNGKTVHLGYAYDPAAACALYRICEYVAGLAMSEEQPIENVLDQVREMAGVAKRDPLAHIQDMPESVRVAARSDAEAVKLYEQSQGKQAEGVKKSNLNLFN